MKNFSWSAIGGFAFMMLAFGTSAQTPPGSDSTKRQGFAGTLQETLKDIPQANVSCRKEDFAPTAPAAVGRSSSKPDASCTVTLHQLSAMLDKPETVLVDTRARANFEAGHIDGAVNFSESEIRTKRFLSNKSMVLIGDGKADLELYALCGDLKSAGFKQVKVLKGGMPAWLLESRPVIGTATEFAVAARLSAGELFQESKSSDNVIITLPGMHALSDLLPMAVRAPQDDLASIKNLIQAHKRKKPGMPYSFILVADERFDKGQLSALAKAALPESLLIFSESEPSYRQFMRVQNAMWAKQAKGPTKPRCGV